MEKLLIYRHEGTKKQRKAGREEGKKEKEKYSHIITWENSHIYFSRSEIIIINILMTDAIWKVA